MSRIGKSTETCRSVVARGLGEECLLNGYRISFWGNEKVLDLNSSKLHNITNVLNATNGKFCFVYFTTIKNWFFKMCSLFLSWQINFILFYFFKLLLKKKNLADLGLSCGTRNLRASCGIFHCGMWAWLPHCMGNLSFQTRNQTHVPVMARWGVLNHWTTMEVPQICF